MVDGIGNPKKFGLSSLGAQFLPFLAVPKRGLSPTSTQISTCSTEG
jgi:hypothetical protein